ncbi:hypothetical protein V1460_01510 [Streptomyces sp. SCSIO 30461]|uniref:hypothetical protein n=1 Tax=Streptomyces sp. SCSIO 30461 TaxID=3118085 RepID=UPI0030CFCF2A
MRHIEKRAEGAGPFTTRLTWRPAAGGIAVWESRAARKRGTLRVRAAEEAPETRQPADAASIGRLGTLNTVAAVTFTIGGALFAAGAAIAIAGAAALTSALVYFAGGLSFNAGGYASLLQTINAPTLGTTADTADTLETRRWRWWSYEPMRIDWLSTFVLFAGTLVFGLNLLDSFLQGLSTQQANRLIWTPDMVGCLLFLISGHLALEEVCHGHPDLRPHDLGWWIVAVNQAGSVLFMISALADFNIPSTGSLVNASIANWGTLTGALCFSVGGVLQLFERPQPADR